MIVVVFGKREGKFGNGANEFPEEKSYPTFPALFNFFFGCPQ